MRKAEEILAKNCIGKDAFIGANNIRIIVAADAINAINEARKEAIEECAKVAKLNYSYGYGTYDDKGTSETLLKDEVKINTAGHGDSSYKIITVDKKSILNLINELQ